MTQSAQSVQIAKIESMIYVVRGQRVMLDSDIAELYGVETKRLNEQVKRNLDRFPEDFMFQLAPQEVTALKSQIATSKQGRGGRRTRPYAFTEHGAIMLANVLNSDRAIETSVFVVRAFVRMREILASQKELVGKIEQIERKVGKHDDDIKALVAAIRQLIIPPGPKKKQIGFK
ncbi:MAG: ORF6N domain-containing protein [candidate division Zixibacteria bacterium]|nr:ORF6N domain-containing protein [candidate division Zixibacteria bacterium]MBU1471339.1 ORF6N domain-containing protein [candidate division Zixibacteria bacterium]MBU2626218.1 ORF6N domain-containing protein [candidate division Zixibacteria bacterium]